MVAKIFSAHTMAIAICLASGQGAMSDSPDRKNLVSGQEIIDIYNGKTWVWSTGGSYWGGGGQFEAIHEDAVGVGKWYPTSRGSLCYEAVWKWDPNKSGEQVKRCWKHVRDSKGVLWKHDPFTNDWYRPAKELAERVTPGNRIRSEVLSRRRKFGL